MERIDKKYADLVRIHTALGIAINRYNLARNDKNKDELAIDEKRDSVIKRFELTYDLLWKYLKLYISTKEGIVLDSPRKVFQQCMSLGITNKEESDDLMLIIESRNLTTHVYDSDLAEEVAAKIVYYFNVIQAIVRRVTPEC